MPSFLKKILLRIGVNDVDPVAFGIGRDCGLLIGCGVDC